MGKLFATILIFAAIVVAGCGKEEDTPTDALTEIQAALADRNSAQLSRRIDLEDFFAKFYDAATIELAENYDYYRKKYPKDPYFNHDAEFLKNYNDEFKTQHLKFAEDVVINFFKRVPEPEKPTENLEAYVANEFEKIRRAIRSEIKSVTIDENSAEMILNLNGDSTLIGQFVSDLDLTLGFTKDENGNWHLQEIKNMEQLTPLIVDKAEIIRISFF